MANNINSLNVGLSTIQKLYVGSAYVNLMPSTDKTVVTITTELPNMYALSETGTSMSDALYMHSGITNNNRSVDSIYFYYDSRYGYNITNVDFTVSYQIQSGKYICSLSQYDSSCAMQLSSIQVSKTTDGIIVSANVSPGYVYYTWRDDNYKCTLYWDSAHTDRSNRQFAFKVTGQLVWYEDDSNHAGGNKLIVPVTDITL